MIGPKTYNRQWIHCNFLFSRNNMKKSQIHCQTGENMLIWQWALRNNLVGIFQWKVHIWRFVQGFVTFNGAIRRRLSSAFSSATSFGSDRWLGVERGDGECTEGTVSEQNRQKEQSRNRPQGEDQCKDQSWGAVKQPPNSYDWGTQWDSENYWRIAQNTTFRQQNNWHYKHSYINVIYTHVSSERVGKGGVKVGWGAQWAKSGGEAVLLQLSDFTKDPMHDFNRLFAETPVTVSFDHILCTFLSVSMRRVTHQMTNYKNHFCSCGTVLMMSLMTSKPRTQLCSRLYNFHIHVLWNWQEKSLTMNYILIMKQNAAAGWHWEE